MKLTKLNSYFQKCIQDYPNTSLSLVRANCPSYAHIEIYENTKNNVSRFVFAAIKEALSDDSDIDKEENRQVFSFLESKSGKEELDLLSSLLLAHSLQYYSQRTLGIVDSDVWYADGFIANEALELFSVQDGNRVNEVRKNIVKRSKIGKRAELKMETFQHLLHLNQKRIDGFSRKVASQENLSAAILQDTLLSYRILYSLLNKRTDVERIVHSLMQEFATFSLPLPKVLHKENANLGEWQTVLDKLNAKVEIPFSRIELKNGLRGVKGDLRIDAFERINAIIMISTFITYTNRSYIRIANDVIKLWDEVDSEIVIPIFAA